MGEVGALGVMGIYRGSNPGFSSTKIARPCLFRHYFKNLWWLTHPLISFFLFSWHWGRLGPFNSHDM